MYDLGPRILYISKYAPLTDDYRPEFHSKDGIAPVYHYEIFTILKQLGYKVTGSRSLDYLYSNSKNFDYVFSLYNRMPFNNSEVFPSSLCEYLKIPYLGSSPVVRSIAEDKNLTKIIARYCGVTTPLWNIFRTGEKLTEPEFEPPYFIKPRFGASSEFVNENSLVHSWTDAITRISYLLDMNIEVILEQFAPGINLTLPVIFLEEPLVLPVIQATSNIVGNILSYNQKRMIEPGIKRKIFTNKDVTVNAISDVLKFFKSLDSPLDYARFDFRYDNVNKCLNFLEFNVCSNLGSHSTICQSANAAGMSQFELVKTILDYSLQRQKVLR
jgi:D-alanine-D-alanine ligase